MAQAPQATPLMPHATAAWLVDNSSLTFEQIAEFCGLHILEVQAIADDTAATKLTGRDPLRSGELTHEEIEKGQRDPSYRLQMHRAPAPVTRPPAPPARAGPPPLGRADARGDRKGPARSQLPAADAQGARSRYPHQGAAL